LARFAKLGIQVSVDLQVQEKDGYPMRLKDSDIIRLFGPLQSITSDWDLKECNNRLVTYIDRARVLRQAYELKQGLPSSLSTRTSVIVQSESSTFLIQQMDKIRTMLADVKRRRAEKENTRQKVKDEMERQERRYRTQVETIRKRQETLDSLAQEEAKLRCRECSGSSLIKYYGSAAQVPSRSVHPWPSIHAEELRLTGLQFDRIDVDSYRRDEREKLIIKIKTEFHEKFLAALNEARMNYKKKGVMEIEIEEDIMKIYQKIIRDRAEQNGTRYSLDGLHKLWNGRNYQARIQQLLTDIESLKSRIHGAEGRGAGERADWEREMRSLDAALDAALARLREMMGSLSVFNVTSETQLDEVAMYQQLLQFETLRLQRPASHYRATVTQRTVRGGGGVSGAGFSRGRHSSADSGRGYSKAATPDGTLDHGVFQYDMIEHKQEDNSYHRARQSKIKGQDKFLDPITQQPIHMGSLELSLHYNMDTLIVHLHQARNIAGKRSQDPYAQVFLIEERPPPYQGIFEPNQKAFFEKRLQNGHFVIHDRTETFDKNLSPKFNEQFSFKMDSGSLLRKSLVISIWDADSTTRDDFMAGVTLPLRDLDRFLDLGSKISIDLKHQEMDGYPGRLASLPSGGGAGLGGLMSGRSSARSSMQSTFLEGLEKEIIHQ